MDDYLILARSVTFAQRMQKALSRAGVRNQIYPGAKGSDGSGMRLCGADRAAGSASGASGAEPGGAGAFAGLWPSGNGLSGDGPMIYLDSAATTFQKPPSVARAMTNALATMSSPGRGDTRWPCGRRRRPFSAGQNWRSCFMQRTRSGWY